MKPVMKLTKLIATIALGATGMFSVFADAPKDKPTPYPLKTCIVSGEKLGEMGDPVVFVENGQEVKLCCKSCKKDFTKDKTAYLKKISEATKAPKK